MNIRTLYSFSLGLCILNPVCLEPYCGWQQIQSFLPEMTKESRDVKSMCVLRSFPEWPDLVYLSPLKYLQSVTVRVPKLTLPTESDPGDPQDQHTARGEMQATVHSWATWASASGGRSRD